MTKDRILVSVFFCALACVCSITSARRVAASGAAGAPNPATASPFAPSNARTEDGHPIPAAQFFPARRCLSCHQDTHAAWAASLHRNAGREPFYRDSVDILARQRGRRETQHCESCHAPVAVLSGALLKDGHEPHDNRDPTLTTVEDEGVTCTVCHSITSTRLDGTGSYTLRRPALLARADGMPVEGDVSDAAILANVDGHRRAVMRPLLKTPEFCAACHKSSAPPALNNYKFLRGFSTYDEWQQSGASHETVAAYYPRPQRLTCNSCHMPKVESLNDRAAKGGEVSSHRWLGANTAVPLFYGDQQQLALTEKFLQNKVLNVDIFALGSPTAERRVAPLSPDAVNRVPFMPGEEVTVEVVVSNRKAAHSFPPELRDMYEPWVEFEAFDGSGQSVYHSGFVKADQTLDESAHVYKSVLLDGDSRVVTRHQMWDVKAKAYDNAVAAGRSDIARFRFRLPPAPKGSNRAAVPTITTLTLRARVNYRRFVQEYTDYVLARHGAPQLSIPIVKMAETEVKLIAGSGNADAAPTSQNAQTGALRWNDYAIGLFEQAQYGPASEAFQQAAALSPRDPFPLVSAAVAELRIEQYGLARAQLGRAAELIGRALRLDPVQPRTRFFHALLLRSQGQASEAAAELGRLAAQFPRDREIARQFGQTVYGLNQLSDARQAFETILAIDPTDAGAFQFLAPIYAAMSQTQAADGARSLYLLWRDDPLAESVAARFFAANPQWGEERVLSHAHGADSPMRPTLIGQMAAPDR